MFDDQRVQTTTQLANQNLEHPVRQTWPEEHDLADSSLVFFNKVSVCWYVDHWIGFHGKIWTPETMVVKTVKYRAFRLKFSHHPTLWVDGATSVFFTNIDSLEGLKGQFTPQTHRNLVVSCRCLPSHPDDIDVPFPLVDRGLTLWKWWETVAQIGLLYCWSGRYSKKTRGWKMICSMGISGS